MVKEKFIKGKTVRFVLIALFFLISTFLIVFLDYQNQSPLPGKSIKLELLSSFNIPLPEISGMQLKRISTSKFKVYFVGDKLAKIATADFDRTKMKFSFDKYIDFSSPLLERYALCSSPQIKGCRDLSKIVLRQWESITSDTSNRLFVLNESLATIVVLDPQFERVSNVINLQYFSTKKQRKKSLSHALNNLGEGFILAKNGRIFLAKERNKAQIIEYGSVKDKALGYSSEKSLKNDQPFKLSKSRVSMVPLYSWRLPKGFEKCDLSELTTDEQGNMYALSQSCRFVGMIEELNPKQKRMSFTRRWQVPNKLDSAESLAVVSQGTFLIGEDRKTTEGTNVFLLRDTVDRAIKIAQVQP